MPEFGMSGLLSTLGRRHDNKAKAVCYIRSLKMNTKRKTPSHWNRVNLCLSAEERSIVHELLAMARASTGISITTAGIEAATAK